ncbi:ABC transporter permease/M1 family aminopeptidase [Sphingomonas jaspsi]|uniref:ABC transporter permease/M1 family aminopeptidase n=1 Tax=Sphingomonas jaspsi TaxID=392409 RepID=UPI0004ACCB6A|nr:M1 family aminopeptidase [Sphingomonas jaspsi]
MFLDIMRFEIRYHLRNPVFWVAVGIFVLLGFGLTASENVSFGTPGAVHENAPFAVGVALAVFAIFYQFVTTSFVANAVVRDDTTGFGQIMRTTPISRTAFIMGRFVGGLIIALLGYLATPLGMMVGVEMPWVDAETVGPNGPAMYLWQFSVVALPNIFLSCALLLALATYFRSMLASYVGVVVILMGYTVTLLFATNKPEWLPYLAKFELLGFSAIQDLTRYWTTADLNSRLFPLHGNFLINRLFVIGLGSLLLAGTVWRFSFSERAPSKRRLRKLAKREARDAQMASVAPETASDLPSARFGSASTRAQFLTRLRAEMVQVLKSPGLIVILLLAIFNSLADLLTTRAMYGTPTYPLTANVISSLRDGYLFFTLMIAIFYGGELVWRERERKINEIVDSTPSPDWVMIVPKVLAILAVLLLVVVSGSIAGMATQLAKGVFDFSPTRYLLWYIAPVTIDSLLIAILAVFMQVLSPNKYVGWGLMLLWFVSGVFLSSVGYDDLLYTYGSSPMEPLSDMNGDGGFWIGAAWARAYWLAGGALLLLFAHLVWPRGTVTAVRPRVAALSRRLGRGEVVFGLAALAVMILSGSVIYHATHQLNVRRTSDDREVLIADLEKRYLRYENLPQPTVRDVKLAIQIFPQDRKLETNGAYRLVNETAQPLTEVHLRVGDDDVKLFKLSVDGANSTRRDVEHGYYIFRFDEPLAPGQSTMAHFATRIWYRGFRNDAQPTDVTPNGTFVNNYKIAPIVGMDRNGLLRDRTQRRRQGLPAELRPAKLEDMTATARNYVGTSWVHSDISVTTDAGQVPVAPGDRVSDKVENGRRTARFVSSAPINNFFSVQSARYAIDQRMQGDVATEIYYDPRHSWNVPVMQKALGAALDYYRANFGPYQFRHARILEFPGYAGYAQAFAGTMPYSESIGFAANLSNAENIDYVTYVVAHELGHQYWAHQAVGADMQGATLTSETLAQYSALMVMKKLYGPDSIRRFLKYELDDYLRSRKGEALEELPLARVENQAYVHYNKGALAMYLLQQRLGEDRVNLALRTFLDRWKFKGPPYHRSLDFIAELRKVARTPDEQALITDLFERITLYDLKVTDAQTRQQGTQWVTTLTVDAAKYHADGKGAEKAVPLRDRIEIGLFTARPGEGSFGKANVISIDRRPVVSGKQTIVVRSNRKPEFAGVDPYAFYVDRNSNDNIMSVSTSR